MKVSEFKKLGAIIYIECFSMRHIAAFENSAVASSSSCREPFVWLEAEHSSSSRSNGNNIPKMCTHVTHIVWNKSGSHGRLALLLALQIECHMNGWMENVWHLQQWHKRVISNSISFILFYVYFSRYFVCVLLSVSCFLFKFQLIPLHAILIGYDSCAVSTPSNWMLIHTYMSTTYTYIHIHIHSHVHIYHIHKWVCRQQKSKMNWCIYKYFM